jgi:hypothetical protein
MGRDQKPSNSDLIYIWKSPTYIHSGTCILLPDICYSLIFLFCLPWIIPCSVVYGCDLQFVATNCTESRNPYLGTDFYHGNVKSMNITVKRKQKDLDYCIFGILAWEDSSLNGSLTAVVAYYIIYFTKFWSENLEERDHLEDVGVDGWLELKWIFKNWDVCDIRATERTV